MNWLEKKLPKVIRNRMSALIVTALGLFLALQYNEVVREIINSFIPVGEGLTGKVIYILILTIVIIYATVAVEKALDGK
jgi:hypothetical protein